MSHISEHRADWPARRVKLLREGYMEAALAQQSAAVVPDHRVYAVIDSMGWDLDDQEKDDMYRLCRAMLAAAPAAPVAVWREPVARAFGKVCGGDAEHNTVNVRVSGPVPPELWTIGTAVALYAAPPAAQNPTGDSASPVAEQPDTVSDLGLRHTAPWDSARVGDYNAGWNDRHMAGMRDGEQPDTVAVPRKLLAEAESIIESYAEALKASHAPGGDWEGEEAAHDDYEREAGVASKLRAILAGGAK